MMHIKAVDVKVVVINSADLENKAVADDDEGRVEFSDRDVRQGLPLIAVDVVHVAVKVSHGHATHAHVCRQV